MPQAPEAFTRDRLQTLETTHRATQRRSMLLLSATVLSTALAALLLFLSVKGRAPLWPAALPVLAVVGLARPWLSARRALDRVGRLTALYDASLNRLTHQPAESPQLGEAFREPDHLFDRDLNLLGPNSLFALLATTRTRLGQRALAKTLLHPPSLDASHERQQAILALTPNTDLRERIALLGPSSFVNLGPETFEPWLDEPPTRFPRIPPWVLSLTSTIALILVLAWVAGRLPNATVFPNLAAVLALQAAVTLLFRPKALPILEATEPRPGQIQLLRDGLALLDAPPAGADRALNQLQRHLFLVEQRKTEWCYLPCLFFASGTHAAIRINRWKIEHGATLREWLAAWASFDALNAFATYAFEHPENTYPELLASPAPQFEATALTHPLLPDAIANDIALGATRFYLISGSNMAGKSTLLRSMGLAVVLARAGAPIPAQHCRLTPLALGASLTPTDSLAEGKSRFFAEVHRLQQILATARQSATLFLIDELFSGTNSADRLTAAEGVLKALLQAGAIGALSTHDLALTTLVSESNTGQNVHMASPDPTDPLAFDYLLKPGVNTHTNALAFLKLLHLDE